MDHILKDSMPFKLLGIMTLWRLGWLTISASAAFIDEVRMISSV